MNSTNDSKSIISILEKSYDIKEYSTPKNNEISITVDQNDLPAVLSHLKSLGWKQLSLLTCVDWIKENKFELVYILFNWTNAITFIVRTKIERENPQYISIVNIFPGAKYYERDVHEFFGVKFEGNEDSEKPLFLELWDDKPPMKKDFDPLEYSKRKFPDREYDVESAKKTVIRITEGEKNERA
ncbi:NADH dehydrogenase [Petrotoga sp. 9PW.55.5.1]|uniref:NADH-quinone oxidoreductase subunit C n=1 Tax=Petrotoga sp. 9PW.55.5.1 TaxID=1308979 RepID=UPI000DC2EECC|nr:NADH-quinone oxidoreductase subunit C [Petrotoga sp. 9PW.55.5.1]RAO99305.1 NADH dehydrogenase [Petrotoga sp. 9PW.55.5.1]